MTELSLHILDIVQNSITAGAEHIDITIDEDTAKQMLAITVDDDGCGMDAEMVQRVRDPFTTSRKTRGVGLGIPLFEQAAVATGGYLTIDSTPGSGTRIRAVFQRDSIDRQPLGDMVGTMVTLLSDQRNEDIVFLYRHIVDGNAFVLDTAEVSEVLDGLPMSDLAVIDWLKAYIEEGLADIGASE